MPFPRIQTCIVCEGVRAEPFGKLLIFGYYGVAPEVQIALLDYSVPVNLCFLFPGGAGSGNFRVAVRLTAPDGTNRESIDGQGSTSFGPVRSNIVVYFQNTLPGPGRYTLTLLVDGRDNYQTAVELRQGTLDEMTHAGAPA